MTVYRPADDEHTSVNFYENGVEVTVTKDGLDIPDGSAAADALVEQGILRVGREGKRTHEHRAPQPAGPAPLEPGEVPAHAEPLAEEATS